MHIAFFSDNFYPELSGISDSIIITGHELARRGHRVSYVVPRYGNKAYRIVGARNAGEPFVDEHVRFIRVPALSIGGPTGQARMVIPYGRHTIFQHSEMPDIIHSHLFFGLGLEALWTASRNHIPFIGTSHTLIQEVMRYGVFRGAWIKRLSARYVAWYYNHCALVTAPSESILRDMERFHFHAKSRVVSNPIDTELFHPCHNDDERETAIQECGFSNFTVLVAGRLAPDKHIDVVMRAFRDVKNVVPSAILAIAGHGIEEKKLRDLARILHIEDGVRFLGTVPHDRLARMYRAASAFVIMSTSETQSMVLLQAQASGLPVVVARAGALPEYVRSEFGDIVEPGDSHMLAHSLITLAQSQVLRDARGREARRHALQFSVSSVVDTWEKIYNDIQSI